MHRWGKAASSRASWRRRRPSASPGSVTRLTRPMRSASMPSTPRPVSSRSIARLWPMRRGRLIVPRSTSGTPKRRQYTPRTASDAATRRSHHSASSSPPATAGPSMAAITGLRQREPRRTHRAGTVVGHRATIALGERLEVGTGAEVASGAGQHGDGQRLVGVEVDERLEQRCGGDRVDGVAAIRAIDGHDANRPVVVDAARRRSRQPAGLSSERFSHGVQPDCREYAAIDVPDVRQRSVLRLVAVRCAARPSWRSTSASTVP